MNVKTNKALKILTAPLGEGLTFFMLLLIMTSIMPACDYVKNGLLNYGAYAFLANLCLVYILTLILYSIKGKLAMYLRLSSIIVCGLYFAVELFCFYKFHRAINIDFIGILYGTNGDETKEFLQTFVDFNYVLLLSVCVLGISLSSYLFRKVRLHKYFQRVFLFFVAVSFLLCIRNVTVFKYDTFLGHICMLFNHEELPDLHKYCTFPKLVSDGRAYPQNVVLIIGESFSRCHSSLYGYGKQTNPRLAQLKRTSRLYVYDRISSPALNTVPAFKNFMSTWNPSSGKEWYVGVTIPEIAHLCGYKSYWISNQSKNGLWDNVVGLYADLCDNNYFVGEKSAGLDRKTYDEDVLPLLRNINGGGKNFCFIHLMGSHVCFNARYPENRAYFKETEYMSCPAPQRSVRAAYDNSILYNDSVVYEIMRCFEDKEAVVVYFSDHALDIYQSSDNYCAHGNPGNPVSKNAGMAIPFMIYVSEKYKMRFPEKVKRMERSLHNKYSTANLIYTIMDIIGVEFERNKNVTSLFSTKKAD